MVGTAFAADFNIMPRRRRYGMAGFVFHVINRGARRGKLFEDSHDYEQFVAVLRESLKQRPIRLLNFCAMPNHFHLLVWPETDTQLPRFMHWLTGTHSVRWRLATDTVGEGALYQGRYKAIPVQTEAYFLTVARYVERNPIRANLVGKAEEWPWGSLWYREVAKENFPLAEWPVPRPVDWLACVNRPQTAREIATIRRSLKRGCALGDASWQDEVAKTLGVPGYFRAQGRPRRNAD